MPWLSLDYADEAKRKGLASAQGVLGIPALHKMDASKITEPEKDWREKFDQINSIN